MIKIKLFKIFCIILAAGSICIIPVNVMEASRAHGVVKNTSTAQDINTGINQRMKKKVTRNNNVSVKKKENGIIVDTSLSAGDQKKLFKQYKEYEIKNKDGVLYYNNKLVRCFADIYGVESYNANGGKTINSKSIYSYFNENGDVDVCIKRENIKNGEKWSFGKITNWTLSLEDIAFAMPEKVINKLLAESVKKGNYNDIEVLFIYADKESINSAVKQIMANGGYKIIEGLAWNMNIEPSVLGRVAIELIEKSQYDVLTNIAAFLERKDLEEVAKILYSKKEYNVFSGISWAFDKSTIDKYAKQFADKGEFEALYNIAWNVSSSTIGEIAKQFVENKQYEALQKIICFVDKEETDKIARKLYEQGDFEEIGNIAWNISREVLEELAKLMTDKEEYNGLMYIIPFIA
ncbi:MAG: hypothetical protein HFH68_10625 [Lachnospiraceae bacterium]|nr:hypothetical protein [Lachnospiraceae bacterium]